MEDEKSPPHIILFTGHMIDAPARENPRFPRKSEELARTMIRQAVASIAGLARQSGKVVIGISGGASGGDILFQEVCRGLGIKSKLYLALPKEKYIELSVAPAGETWVTRFNTLFEKNKSHFLPKNTNLKHTSHPKLKQSIWEKANLWMLENATAITKGDFTLIALWDGKRGDGPGGTKDMVAKAQAEGAGVIHLDAKLLLT